MPFSGSLVETITLATRLPARYPFHPGPDPVLGNRYSAFVVNWGPVHFSGYQAMPRSHWDNYHGVSFSCNPASRGWCAFFFEACRWACTCPHANTQGQCPVGNLGKLFLACFNWSQGPPSIYLARLDNAEPAKSILLASQLGGMSFESDRQAESLVQSVFEGAVGYKEHTATNAGPVRVALKHRRETVLGDQSTQGAAPGPLRQPSHCPGTWYGRSARRRQPR
jgi:hypothetical protein